MADREKDPQRAALVHMVNVLGAPRPCPCNKCDGCEYERDEAIRTGLEALGYLEQEFIEEGREELPGGGIYHKGHWRIEPDPLEAWENFMRGELGVELREGWKEKREPREPK